MMKTIVVMKVMVVLVFALITQIAFSALPPNFQNTKDLDAMVAFSKSHKKIMASLKSIDLTTHIIYFGNNCKVVFVRKIIHRDKGWAGPAAPLEFKYSTCSL